MKYVYIPIIMLLPIASIVAYVTYWMGLAVGVTNEQLIYFPAINAGIIIMVAAIFAFPYRDLDIINRGGG